MRREIKRICTERKLTALYVTHDREEAFAIADRIMVMRRGNVEAFGSPEEIYRHPASLFVANFTGEGSAVPMSVISGEDSENVLFFRPEDIVLDSVQNPEEYICLEGARVESCEFNGAGYMVKLSYQGYGITAYSTRKPQEENMSVFIPRAAAIELK